MKNCYINGIGSVSIQATGFSIFDAEITTVQNVNKAQQPSYKELIAPAMSRRMAKGVKMSIYAANKALFEAKMVDPQAIIVGTGLGCIEDSEKFLDAIIENEEQFLTPTAFIQSTHNTVAAQIALLLQCKAYNFTYVNGANSFENALFDAFMQLKHLDKENILIGGVDEIAPYTFSMFEMVGKVKRVGDNINFKKPETNGIPLAEGANFFALSVKKTANTYAEVVDLLVFNDFKDDETSTIKAFLEKNNLSVNTIDVIVLGVNADAVQQPFYHKIQVLFTETPQAYYQHISGSYDTASAFGLKVAAEIIRSQSYPEKLKYNEAQPEKIENILLVNQNNLTDFSFVLLSKC
ncbi:3-oxoacyl-(acyl-carrier-protein) synthase [Paenimyroides aquimaris]|uniref:3-oxoacyl-(Acyl-carrier-protein) synthase n=1 Tax=Paenimyroides marinum TaxID=1159016 RepID=A0A1H6LVW7_9FLAO|nr:beta-ketoacyl synthase chain length factor [Paenimyroides aquimaris]SEH90633.1 3-oxoacyl-(acyl-carrier-protein) synthase [Paenimyroides aquimaris]